MSTFHIFKWNKSIKHQDNLAQAKVEKTINMQKLHSLLVTAEQDFRWAAPQNLIVVGNSIFYIDTDESETWVEEQ